MTKKKRSRSLRDARQKQFEALEARQMLSAAFPNSLGPTPPPDLGIPAMVVNITPPEGLYENVNGTGNNEENPDWGSAGIQLLRLTTPEYADGISEPAGEDRASARAISNLVADQEESVVNDRYLTNMLWVWGQFIDHDIDLTTGADPVEELPIEVPAGDEFFDPFNTGTQEIGFERSIYDTETGDESGDPRQQINTITAFLDGSVVYGSDEDTTNSLREFVGGRMSTSDGDLLPVDEFGFFMAGDIRANENAALIAMQTLWVREHNYWADQISAENPDLTDEEIFQQARSIVIAELQVITYNEYLPALLGADAISEYEGYDSSVNPGIANVFSTAAYRFGHSMLSSELARLNADGTEADEGNLALRDAFFNPSEISDNGIDSILRGVSWTLGQEIDNQIVDDVRNFLFGTPTNDGFDLAALNIQRGRDHGLADYNQTRIDMGLDPVTSFAEISSDPDVQAALEAAYDSVDDIDVWVGGLAEDHLPGSSMGELFTTIIADQFERIRDGDQYWYQNVYHGAELRQLENTTLADVMERNTDIDNLQENVFFDPSVLVVDVPNGRGAGHVVVTTEGDNVVVKSGHGNHVLASGASADLSQVVIRGVANRADRVTIDVARGELSLEGGVVIYGGDSHGDTLTVRTGDGDDKVTVDGNDMSVNGMNTTFVGVERVVIDAGRGENDVQVGEDVDAEVDIARHNRHRRNHGGGHNHGPLQRGGTNLSDLLGGPLQMPGFGNNNDNGNNNGGVLNQIANMGPFSLVEFNPGGQNNNNNGGGGGRRR